MKNFTRAAFALLFLLFAVGTLSTEAHAEDTLGDLAQEHILTAEPTLTKSVKAMLSGYEWTPKAQDWSRLPPEATREVLIALAASPDAGIRTNANALVSLVHFPHPRSSEAIRIAAADVSADLLIRRGAIRSFGHADPKAARAALPMWLSDSNIHIREVALISAENLLSPADQSFLEGALSREESPELKLRIQALISGIKAP